MSADREMQFVIADSRPASAATVNSEEMRLRARVETLECRLQKVDAQRRAMLHIMGDLHETNTRLANQRNAFVTPSALIHRPATSADSDFAGSP